VTAATLLPMSLPLLPALTTGGPALLAISPCHSATDDYAVPLVAVLAALWLCMIASCWLSQLCVVSTRSVLRYGKLQPNTAAINANLSKTAHRDSQASNPGYFKMLCSSVADSLYINRSTAFASYYATAIGLFAVLAVSFSLSLTLATETTGATATLAATNVYAETASANASVSVDDAAVGVTVGVVPALQGLVAAFLLLLHLLRRLCESLRDCYYDYKAASLHKSNNSISGITHQQNQDNNAQSHSQLRTQRQSKQHIFVCVAGCVFYVTLVLSTFVSNNLFDLSFISSFFSATDNSDISSSLLNVSKGSASATGTAHKLAALFSLMHSHKSLVPSRDNNSAAPARGDSSHLLSLTVTS